MRDNELKVVDVVVLFARLRVDVILRLDTAVVVIDGTRRASRLQDPDFEFFYFRV